MKARLGAVWLTLAALPAQAQDPPRWAYLAECSAVFRSVALSRGYTGVTEDQIAQAEAAAQAFRAQAVVAAAEAGQAEAEADVTSILVYLQPRWENRIDRLMSVQSNLDWIAYCGRLGREEGILTPETAP